MAADPGSLDLALGSAPAMECGGVDHNSSQQRMNTSVLHDEFYSALKEHFCMVGRGRRPSLPSIAAPTQRLFAQLCLLKDTTNSSWETVTSWFLKLFPDWSMTRGKLEYSCNKAMDQIAGLNGDDLIEFMNTPVPQDSLSSTLIQCGLSRTLLLNTKPDNFKADAVVAKELLNIKLVTELESFRVKERQPVIFTAKWVLALLLTHCDGTGISESSVRHRVSQILNKYKHFKSKRVSVDQLNMFFNESLLMSFTVTKLPRNLSEKKKDPAQNVIKQYENNLTLANKEIENLKLREKSKQSPTVSKGVQANDKSLTKIQALQREIMEHSKNKISMLHELELLKQSLKDKEQEIVALKHQIKSEQTLKSKYKRQYEETLMTSEAILNSEDGNVNETVNLKSESKNAFSDDVHLTYMALQGEGNVAASNCSKVINLVSKYLYKKEIPIENLPCTQTALNMSSEGHYLSKVQTAETLLESTHFTLATDGTSRQKRQFIERHIVLPNGKSMSLGYTEVVSDNAETLLEKTVELLQELSELYSEESNMERQAVFKEILSKMKCLMSDRAAVMKLFDKKLENFKKEVLGEDVSTHFLFCNAHFLLGLSSAAEDGSKEIEEELKAREVLLGRDASGNKFARFSQAKETAPCRVIRAAADIFGPRGDEKNGCRNQWLAFLESRGVQSKFTSYRSNRFNNLFQNAFALMYHREHVIKFLEDLATHSNLKTQSVLEDVKDDNIIAMVGALSHFNYCFTSPYWLLMNSNKPYGEFPTYVKKMEAFLSQECGNESVFSDFTNNEIYLEVFKENEIFSNMYKKICSNSLIVLRRQLSDFIDGGIFGGEIAADVLQVLMTAPLTNLTGERLFGDLDFDIMKRRRASTHSRSSINMWKHNKTGHWIDKKRNKSRLLKLARHHGVRLQKRSREAEKDIRMKIRAKLQENERLKKEKDLAAKEKYLQIINDVVNQGGICSTKEDLDKIMKGKNTLENLKAQVRYRKVVLKERHLMVSGNTAQLYKSILSSLGYDNEPGPPPKKKVRAK